MSMRTNEAHLNGRNALGMGRGAGSWPAHHAPRSTRYAPRETSNAKRIALLVLVLLLGLTGCFPYGCRREESRALFAADSLSRQLAAGVPVDTLRLVWETSGPEDDALAYPRTVRYGPDGRLFVSDAESDRVLAFGPSGALAREIAYDGLRYPYLMGFRGDTLFVLNPRAARIDALAEGTVARSLSLPPDLPDQALQYAAAGRQAFYLKVVGEDLDGYLARLDDAGRIAARVPLPGPFWRHAGMLRPWGDSLLSLSGFRPVVDLLVTDTLASPARLDTMALAGFDSPMLARSRSFVLGSIDEAPLLTTSAAPAGDRLFVLNLRPGWLRIDVYDRAGRLQRVLVQENPGYDRQFYPVDLDARALAEGGFEIAVAVVQPAPRLLVYRWEEGEQEMASRQ